ncbi:hypothetical protein HT031_004275 [Scenedesmus sp. PABB004]|nr:hypothetical protein HT031_004275 [Scenedesmus sp. PABB004]
MMLLQRRGTSAAAAPRAAQPRRGAPRCAAQRSARRRAAGVCSCSGSSGSSGTAPGDGAAAGVRRAAAARAPLPPRAPAAAAAAHAPAPAAPPPAAVTEADRAFMRQALALAARALGQTHPNPAVGCVIVRDGRVVGEGFHPKAGMPHAEVYALRAAGTLARGATAYVTLEPCNHHGRTPPCSQALVDAGVARVVVGVGDPNPLVAAAGLATLRGAGIEVALVGGAEEDACRELNADFMARMAAAAAGGGGGGSGS